MNDRTWFEKAMGDLSDDDFYIRTDPPFILVYPRKTKWEWEPHETPFRSVLFSDRGVVSAGFPKFFNVFEDDDDTFAFFDAVNDGKVEYTHKLDGTLIIVDRINGGPHYRTRGQFDLGEAFAHVGPLLEKKYPRLLDVVFNGSLMEDYSLLLEYVSPDNQIVIKYDEPEFYLLGMVDKRTLTPSFRYVQAVSEYTGVPEPDYWSLGENPVDAVRKWKDCEGVVARFGPNKEKLIKIKSEEYVRLHALRFRFTERRVKQFCYLHNVDNEEEAFDALSDLGMDYETFLMVRPYVREYIERKEEAEQMYDRFRRFIWPRWVEQDRKQFVQTVKEALLDSEWGPQWFGRAMMYYDNRLEDLKQAIFCDHVLDEHPNTVQQWDKEDVLGTEWAY